MNTFAKPVVVWCLFCACTPSLALAGPSPDALARSILGKAGIHVGVCELPRVGDGILAAALARTGIAQVHGLAAEARAVETARRPAAESKLLGSQVVIEAGSPAAIPLRDWVADLVVVADATDENLPAVPAAEVARVLSPYRGTAVVGNPAGGKGGLSKAALSQWVKATGGTAAIAEDEGGLWAVVKMPPLAGGDDWGHFYHGPDGNPVSSDTVFRAGTCSLQCYDKPNVVDKWGTVVASAGRYFRVPGSFEHTSPYADALVVRSVYNGQILWQRPLEKQFGRNDSLLVATPQRVYLKHNNGVLILDPETGRELRRIVAADERHAVRWLLLCDGVLVTLTGDPQHSVPIFPPRERLTEVNIGANWHNYRANEEIRTFYGRELTGWDAASGERLWTFREERIDPAKLAARHGRLFFYANNTYAACLNLKDGKPAWKTPAPIRDPIRPHSLDWDLNNIITSRQNALVAAGVYLIASQGHGQTQAFSATDGRLLWHWGDGYPFDDDKRWTVAYGGWRMMDPAWKQVLYPMIVEGILYSGEKFLDPLTGNPAAEKRAGIRQMWGCGHPTATASGLLLAQGGAVYDTHNGRQYVRNYMKNACGVGGGPIADGVAIRSSHECLCPEWKDLVVTRTAPRRLPRPGPRLEKGPASVPATSSADPADWMTYRGNSARSASSPAAVAEHAAIRWTCAPQRSGKRPIGDGDLCEFEPDGNATQVIAVGDRIWFGAAEGAVVCLDRRTGQEDWRFWTTGRIMSPPTWHAGRIYVGSGDGWVYCLDAAGGGLVWRYRVAPDERRLMVQGYLGSPWPVLANVLVHDETAFASAGLIGELDGSTFCALDARSGELRWEKRFENRPSPDAAGPDLPLLPSATGQMAWYDGRLWLKSGMYYGPIICDPASGEMKSPVDMARAARDMIPRWSDPEQFAQVAWSAMPGQDIGIMPDGWVALGGPQFFLPLKQRSQPHRSSGFLRADPGQARNDAKGFPQCITVSPDDLITDIPAWDESEAVVYCDRKEELQLCRGFTATLAAHGDASVLDPKKTGSGFRRHVHWSAGPEQCWTIIPEKKHNWRVAYSPVLAGNAVVCMYNTGGDKPWHVVAASRTNRQLLWDLAMPAQPVTGGLSLTRAGDVLVPLVDGRVVCIGENGG